MKNGKAFPAVIFAVLSRLGIMVILAFGVFYFIGKKTVCLIRKNKDCGTLEQFIKSLEESLSGGLAKSGPERKTAANATRQTNARTANMAAFSVKPPFQCKADIPAGAEPGQVHRTAPVRKTRVRMAKVKKQSSRMSQGTIYTIRFAAMILGTALITAVVLISTRGLRSKDALAGQNVLSGIAGPEVLGMLSAGQSEGYPETTPEMTPIPTPEATPEATPEPTTTPAPSGEPQVQPGILIHIDETNDLVASIQERLMELHYMDSDEPTTYYGPVTEYAMQLFQRGHKLSVDGVAGYETLTLLFSDKAEPYLVRKGDKGTDIDKIQERLAELGYLDDKDRDGRFDEETDYAVRVFQGRNKLSQDGIVGHHTTQVLFNEDAKPAKSHSSGGSSSGGSSSGGSSSGGSSGGSSRGSYNANDAASFVAFAKSLMGQGIPYVWGGKTASGLDCSGFIYYCLNQTGNSIGYKTSAAWAQSSYATISSMDDVKPGDILCFDGHVGIYIGDGKMIDSSSSQNGIRITNVKSSTYWNNHWVCGKRIFS